MTWLSEQRSDLARDRILDTAARLFAERGVDGPGMDEVASEAGCSRATLYRYFANRHALQVAFAQREAAVIVAEVAGTTSRRDQGRRTTESVIAYLKAVRARPYLAPWYAGGNAGVLTQIMSESSFVEAVAATLGRPSTPPDTDFVHWVMRIVLSFLTTPGASLAQERRLLERFVDGYAAAAR